MSSTVFVVNSVASAVTTEATDVQLDARLNTAEPAVSHRLHNTCSIRWRLIRAAVAMLAVMLLPPSEALGALTVWSEGCRLQAQSDIVPGAVSYRWTRHYPTNQALSCPYCEITYSTQSEVLGVSSIPVFEFTGSLVSRPQAWFSVEAVGTDDTVLTTIRYPEGAGMVASPGYGAPIPVPEEPISAWAGKPMPFLTTFEGGTATQFRIISGGNVVAEGGPDVLRYQPPTTGTISLTIEATNECGSSSVARTVNVAPPPAQPTSPLLPLSQQASTTRIWNAGVCVMAGHVTCTMGSVPLTSRTAAAEVTGVTWRSDRITVDAVANGSNSQVESRYILVEFNCTSDTVVDLSGNYAVVSQVPCAATRWASVTFDGVTVASGEQGPISPVSVPLSTGQHWMAVETHGGSTFVSSSNPCYPITWRHVGEIHLTVSFDILDNCPGDLDANGVIDGADIGLLLSSWGFCGATCPHDLNNDGKVNGGDLGLLLSGWGNCPT